MLQRETNVSLYFYLHHFVILYNFAAENKIYMLMKKLLLLSAIALVFFSCSEEPVQKNYRYPSVDFSYIRTSLYTVEFTSNCSHYEYLEWDFGDGTISRAENPTHTYDDLGRYTVTLTAYNGDKQLSKDTYINIHKPSRCYVTGVSFLTWYINKYYRAIMEDSNGERVFRTYYTMLGDLDEAYDYIFTDRVQLNLSSNEYYTIYMEQSNNSSKNGTYIIKSKMYRSMLYRNYPTEVIAENNDGLRMSVLLEWE